MKQQGLLWETPDSPTSAEDTDCWCTGPDVMDRVHRYWPQGISLDPCSNRWAQANGWVRARTAWTLDDDSLTMPTWGVEDRTTVLFQPPYSGPLELTTRLCREWDAGHIHEALCLVKLDTSTRWFAEIESRATSIVLFPKRLVHYEGDTVRKGSDFCSLILSLTSRDSAKVRQRALRAAFDGFGWVYA